MRKPNIILFIIFFVSFFLRFYGLNWDQGYHLHPDERMITMVAEKIHFPKIKELSSILRQDSPLNPHFFAYGSLPIYLLKTCGWFASFFYQPFSEYAKLNLIGRMMSTTFDLGTVGMIFLLGKRVFNQTVGYYASLFYGLSVLPIQLAHFYAVDTLLTFFITATLYFLVRFFEYPSLSNSFRVGIFFGMSLATKISATVLLTAIGTTLVADLFLVLLNQLRNLFPSNFSNLPFIGGIIKKIPLVNHYQQQRIKMIFIKNMAVIKPVTSV